MARLTIEHGARPQDGQKKVTNYVYTERGGETQDVTYMYTETETPSRVSSWYLPKAPIVDDIEIARLVYYDNEDKMTFTMSYEFNTEVREFNEGTPYEFEVTVLKYVLVIYGGGEYSFKLYPITPEHTPGHTLIPVGDDSTSLNPRWNGEKDLYNGTNILDEMTGEYTTNCYIANILPDSMFTTWYFIECETRYYTDSQGYRHSYLAPVGQTVNKDYPYDVSTIYKPLVYNSCIGVSHTAYVCNVTVSEVTP